MTAVQQVADDVSAQGVANKVWDCAQFREPLESCVCRCLLDAIFRDVEGFEPVHLSQAEHGADGVEWVRSQASDV
jgi:hypothetical protein